LLRHELTQRELVEKAYADRKELDAAAPSIARVLDKTPLQPGGAGALGILGDLLVTAQAFVTLEVRHASLVEEARKRLKANRPEKRTGPAPDAPQRRPDTTPAPPPAAESYPEEEGGEDGEGAFHFRPDQLSVLKPE
jgi:hypothetical protein